MYDVLEIQDYRQKWLEAERDLAINWIEPPLVSIAYEPIDNADTERADKLGLPSRNLEDYEPGTTQAHVFKALKKVAKSRKLSQKHGGPPVPA